MKSSKLQKAILLIAMVILVVIAAIWLFGANKRKPIESVMPEFAPPESHPR